MNFKLEAPSLAQFRANRAVEKAQENRNLAANKRDYEDEKDWATNKAGDSAEMKEFRNKYKLVMNKLIASNKERDLLAKENKALREESLALQTNLRQMIPGFSNTSCSFPMHNELVASVAAFYKQECLDKFFDLLCPEMTARGVLFFFGTAFRRLSELVAEYFEPAFGAVKRAGRFDSLEGPIMNVLRKSFQGNYKQIVPQILQREKLSLIVDEIQNSLGLQQRSTEVNEEIAKFLENLGELVVYATISDPPLDFDVETIGAKVSYNPLRHEAFDGFIKAKEECWVVLPELRKGKDGEMALKSLVLQTSYVIYN